MTPAPHRHPRRPFAGRRSRLLPVAAAVAVLAALAPAAVAVADVSRPAPATGATGAAAPVAQAGQTAVTSAAAGPLSVAEAVVPLTGRDALQGATPGPDDGNRTFGVQPAGPKKPDARANFTYREIAPGQRLTDYVAFVNISLRPVTLQVYPADAYNNDGGGFDLRRAAEKQTDLGSWIHLRRTSVTVPARSAFITPVELRVPANAEPGDHAAGIVGSMKTTRLDAKGNQVIVDQRVGTRFYVRVKGTLTPQIEITDRRARFHLTANPLTGPADVTYTVKNTGNVRLEGRRSIRVSSLLGLSAQAKDVPALPELLPGGSFTFTQRVDGVVPTFLNTAFVTVDPTSVSGNVDPALAQARARKNFFALSIPGVVLIVAALGGAGWWWWRRRRRRPSAEPGSWSDTDGGGSAGPSTSPSQSEAEATPTSTSTGATTSARVVTWPTRRRRRPGVALVGAGAGMLLALAAGAAAAPAAQAADGTLTFLPGNAPAAVPLFVATSGPCPKQAVQVMALMYGKGLPADGKVVIPPQDKPINHDQAFGVGLQDNLLNFAKEEGLKEYSGAYRITLRCTDGIADATYAQFTGTLTFATPNVYTGPVPAKPPAGLTDGVLAMVFPEYKERIAAAGRAATQEQQIEQSLKAEQQQTSSGPIAPAGQQAANSKLRVSITGKVLGALAVVLALGAAGYLWTRRRPQESPPQGRARRSAEPAWPDEPARSEGRAGQEGRADQERRAETTSSPS